MKDRLAEMQKIARSRKGECLSNEYMGSRSYLFWRCSQGHEWYATPEKIKSGTWCPECAVIKRSEKLRAKKLSEAQAIASSRGGKCLSDSYVSAGTPLEWSCEQGHRWWATPTRIREGGWCRTCFYERRKTTLNEIQKHAQSLGGRCLSKGIESSSTRARFECELGHQWEATVNNVMSGTWCPTCGRLQGANARRVYDYETFCDVVREKGGKVLTPRSRFKNALSKVDLMCSEGHTWQCEAKNVIDGRWCAKCAKLKKKTLEDMDAIAKYHGGKCVSEQYHHCDHKLKWECEKGHQWEATYRSAKRAWCPFCNERLKRNNIAPNKYTIDTMRDVAYRRGWKVLSKTYVNSRKALLWRCDQGHKVSMTPQSVMQNRSCLVCHPRRYTQKDMRALARQKGGKFESKEYTNSRTKHLWCCSLGHRWWATPASILQGSWCPTCARQK